MLSSDSGRSEVQSGLFLPDSLTSWWLQAISVHRDRGVCVDNRVHNVTTFQNFFVRVHMPYNMVEKEEIQINATVYNYDDDPVMVRDFLVVW